jgi:hypothetical protein
VPEDYSFTRSEASRITGRSLTTIDNYLKAGKLPKARRTQEGKRLRWEIPLSDLISSRLLVERYREKRHINLETGETRVEIEPLGLPVPENESKEQMLARLIADVESVRLRHRQMEDAYWKQQYDWWNP